LAQLLTVNEENVLRFRHECFLTKNLSHPNVVKLVGVCWSEELFACCLEFVENGSLEDWLRRTVGGKKYVKPKKKVLGMRGAMSEAETVAKGFDSEGLYDEAKHTETDKNKLEEGKALVDKLRIEVSGQGGGVEEGWEKVLGEDGVELGEGVEAWQRYDKGAKQGLGIAHVVIDAAPSCVMARFMDERNDGTNKQTKTVERSFTAGVYYTLVPVKIPTISDRDSLYRVAYFKDSEESFSSCGYSIKDKRVPVKKGKVRVGSHFCLVVKAVEGSGGEQTAVWRFNRISPK
jgi:hypothetical protein